MYIHTYTYIHIIFLLCICIFIHSYMHSAEILLAMRHLVLKFETMHVSWLILTHSHAHTYIHIYSSGIVLAMRLLVFEKLTELQLWDQYAFFIFTRTDHLHLCPHPPLSFFRTQPDYLYVYGDEAYGGYSDRHMAGWVHQFVACYSVKQCAAVCRSVVQCAAVCCCLLLSAAVCEWWRSLWRILRQAHGGVSATTCWSMVQCVAVCCSVVQCAAVYRSAHQYWGYTRKPIVDTTSTWRGMRYVVQGGAVCCSVLQCVAVCCSVLLYYVIICNVLQCAAVYCRVYGDNAYGGYTHLHMAGYVQCGAVWCSVVQRVVVCCSVLLCAAVCCSLLHQLTQGGMFLLE